VYLPRRIRRARFSFVWPVALPLLNLSTVQKHEGGTMKLIVALLSTTLMSVSAFAAGEGQVPVEKEQYLNFNDVYVQKDRGVVEPAELLVIGVFPNGCYKWEKAEVKHIDDFTHEVRGLAKVQQGICTMMLVSFTKEVDLGILKEGQHTARVINADGTIFEKQFTKTR
jgi:hypothetical protein